MRKMNKQASKELLRLAKKINTERTAKGWTQGTLAEKAEITTSYVNLLEGAHREPSFDVLVRLSNVLGGCLLCHAMRVK